MTTGNDWPSQGDIRAGRIDGLNSPVGDTCAERERRAATERAIEIRREGARQREEAGRQVLAWAAAEHGADLERMLASAWAMRIAIEAGARLREACDKFREARDA